MSNDPNKLNFDPIPVGGMSRPELPKVPDLPLQRAAAKAPPAPVETPAAAVPAPPPFSVWSIFAPTRTKGVIAAGIVSLLGGAATMKYVWPPKAPTPVAEVEREPTAPLPPLNPARAPETFAAIPPVVPVSPTPIVPVVGGSTIPEIALPPLITGLPAVSPTPLPVPSTSVVPGYLPLPVLTRTGGLEPPVDKVPVPVVKPVEAPFELKLPELALSGGTTPPTPGAIALPTVSAPTPVPTPAIAPGLLPLPDVKVEQLPLTAVPVPAAKFEPSKEIKIEPTFTPLPVPGAGAPPAKPFDIGVPALVDPTVSPPKLEFTTPLPAVSPFVLAEPPAVAKSQPAPTNAKTEYDVDLHYVKTGDSWAAISKLHFGEDRYADALKGYNQNASLAQLQRAEVPPIHVLRKNYATLIGRPIEKTNEWGAIAPSSATLTSNEPKRSVTGNGYKMYSVPAGGRTLKEIAADAFGDEGLWGIVWDTNPKLVPDKTIPEGTKVYLASRSKIGE